MTQDDFKIIPGYSEYGASEDGLILSFVRQIILNPYILNGYWAVDTFRSSLTETLPVHRAVALAWVHNPDPTNLTVVNHIDGIKFNNWYKNLEWVTVSENNYHAIASGLRQDNIRSFVRDFLTGNVYEFPSVAQAAEFMGLRKDTGFSVLRPKQFGRLINDRYEFRQEGDVTPWFYETRENKVKPSRYMVTVIDRETGEVNELFSTSALLREYQLYGAPSKSIPAIVEYGNNIFPNKQFSCVDSYSENQFRVNDSRPRPPAVPIHATKENDFISFLSLTKCAEYFNVDRATIQNRLNSGKELNGWTLNQLSS